MPMTTVPLAPKNAGGKLNVVAIGRISTVQQDYENIEASHRYVQNYLGHIYQGPLQIKLLGEQASGMLTDRATIREAEDLVATGKVDLVIAEDLARIYRNPRHQYVFVQDCVGDGAGRVTPAPSRPPSVRLRPGLRGRGHAGHLRRRQP